MLDGKYIGKAFCHPVDTDTYTRDPINRKQLWKGGGQTFTKL